MLRLKNRKQEYTQGGQVGETLPGTQVRDGGGLDQLSGRDGDQQSDQGYIFKVEKMLLYSELIRKRSEEGLQGFRPEQLEGWSWQLLRQEGCKWKI